MQRVRLIEFIVIIAALGWMSAFGLAAAQAAVRIDRVAPAWFVFGAILGPIALLLLGAAPPGRCRACSNPTRGWLTICVWCGEKLTVTPLRTMEFQKSTTLPGRSRLPGSSFAGLSRARDWLDRLDQPGPVKPILHARPAAARSSTIAIPVTSQVGPPTPPVPQPQAAAVVPEPVVAVKRRAQTVRATQKASIAAPAPEPVVAVKRRAQTVPTTAKASAAVAPEPVVAVKRRAQTVRATQKASIAAPAPEPVVAVKRRAQTVRATQKASIAAPAPEPVVAVKPAPTELPGAIDPAPVETLMLTTAVYVTGSTALESGRRYIIAIHGPRFRVLGPVDVDPSTIALDRALTGTDATASEGRLVVSGATGRATMVLVFMSVAGTTPELVANAIVQAAETATLAGA